MTIQFNKLDTNTLALIKEFAQAFGEAWGFDEQGVRAAADFIQWRRDELPHEERKNFINILGAYLGECIIRAFGGEWCKDGDGQWCVNSGGVYTLPLSKVAKQLDNGEEDSVLALFMCVPEMLRLSDAQTK